MAGAVAGMDSDIGSCEGMCSSFMRDSWLASEGRADRAYSNGGRVSGGRRAKKLGLGGVRVKPKL